MNGLKPSAPCKADALWGELALKGMEVVHMKAPAGLKRCLTQLLGSQRDATIAMDSLE